MATVRPYGSARLSAEVEEKGFATRRTTPPSPKAPATRQRFSLPRQNRIALETSLPLKPGTQFFVCQSSIANRALVITLKHGRFNATGGQLFISMFPNRVAF